MTDVSAANESMTDKGNCIYAELGQGGLGPSFVARMNLLPGGNMHSHRHLLTQAQKFLAPPPAREAL